jgi:exopolysaccharide biosynthesis polyprenyl glycosylphosphotransferase
VAQRGGRGAGGRDFSDVDGIVTGSELPATEIRESSARVRRIPRRPTPAKGAPLPQYDVRITKELAHRRFVLSVLRQVLRLVSLHALDAVAVASAAFLASTLTEIPAGANELPALIAFMLVGLNLRGSYRPGDARRDAQRLVTGAIIGLVLIALPTTVPTPVYLSREFLIIFGFASIAALIVERRIVDAIVHAAYVRGIGLRRALIITRGHEYMDVLAGIAPHNVGRPAEDQVIVGYVTPEPSRDPAALGALEDLERVLDTRDVSELLVATSLRSETVSELAEVCFERGVRVLVIPSASPTPSVWAELTRIGRLPAYHLHPARLELPSLILKRASDLLLASAGLVLALPWMVLIGISIKIESRGPVFFRQRRVGLGGREFMMWKFRSMLDEAESRRGEIAHLNAYENGLLFKLRGDPRVTRVGRLLRRFSLDELPQVFNILAGDMSLVGPRPPLPSEVRRYEPRHLVRLSVVPGLTGPWQVNGRNLITDFEEVVKLERAYIESWSLRSDMEIILRTIAVVLEGKGAY